MIKKSTLSLVLFVVCQLAIGQTILRGKIFDRGYDRVVIAATVKNLTSNRLSVSDMGGNYKIPANPGDRIIFSSASYIADTLVIKENMLRDGFDVYLTQNIIELEDIDVGGQTKYQIDSMQRAEEFSGVLQSSNNKLVGGKGNTPTDGVGVTFSPITHFSKKEKDQRRFKRFFLKQEEEYYIDSKFSYNYVATTTGLTGDSLRTFMLNYRPTYEFCRSADKPAMLLYINDKYKQYINKNKK